MPESVRVAFCLVLELYEIDCSHSCDTNRPLYFTLLQRVIKQPWEAKAKYQRLCALLPYLGPDVVSINVYGIVTSFIITNAVMLTFHLIYSIKGAGSVCRNTQSSSQMLVHQSPGAMWVRALQASDPAAEARTLKKGFIC